MPNGPGHYRERCRGITAHHHEPTPPNSPGAFRGPGRFPPRTAPGITANAAEISPRTTTSRHRRTAPVLSAGPGVSHREQRRFFPRAPVPASFY